MLTKLCLGFMRHITHTTGFSPVLMRRRNDFTWTSLNARVDGNCRRYAVFIFHGRSSQRQTNSFVLNLATRLGCQHAPKSVNHVAIIAINDIAIGGLHLETVARCP